MGKNRNGADIPIMRYLMGKPLAIFLAGLTGISLIFAIPLAIIASRSPDDFLPFNLIGMTALGAFFAASAKWPKNAPASDKDKVLVARFVFIACYTFLLIKCLSIFGVI